MSILSSTGRWIVSNPLGQVVLLFSIGAFLVTVFRSFFRLRKIQPDGFKWRTLRNELLFATLNLAITVFLLGGTSSFLLRHGYITFNTAPASAWVIASEYALYWFGFDTYFYWLHRWMHLEPFYSCIHKIHHRSTSPNLLTTLSVSPLESLINGGFVPLFSALLTIHSATFALIAPTNIVMGLYVHCGYEFLPRWWNRTWLTRWFITATFHDQHHKYFKWNFGGYTPIWDFLCGTARPKYLAEFDQIKARLGAAANSSSGMLPLLTGVLLLTGTVSASGADVEAALSNTANDHLGFVFTRLSYVLGPDADKSDACPDGLTKGVTEIFKESPGGSQRDGESDQDYNHRIVEGAKALSTAPNGQNMCLNPEAGSPESHFRIVKGSDIALDGLDLDGQFSKAKGKPAPNTCAHDDFKGVDGKSGIDNQFYRAVGCSKSYQSTGPSNSFDTEMLTGAWGILLTLKNAGDGHNAANVEVGIYSNADPIELSPTREPLAHATYAMDQDPRFRAVTHGRIVDGVLTTDPVDVRFHWIVNSIHLERPLQDARIRATINSDGVIEGFLAGYSPVEDIYDVQFGFRSGKDAKGAPASPKLVAGSSNGAAFVLDHTCNGAYYALKQLADGHRDPKTGMCTSISTQYRFKAIPAFVVDAATKSVNSDLDKHFAVDPYKHDSKEY